MLDDGIRIGFLILVGLGLGVVLVWYLSFLYQEVTGTGQVVVDGFTVVRDDGKGDDELGMALAQMLQARLSSLAGELRDAQAGLTTDVHASALKDARSVALVGDVRLWTQTVALQTGLLQPVDVKLSVAGVDVGGLVPWMQRWLTSRRTLHFTIYFHSDGVEIFGSVRALRLPDDALRLTVSGAEAKAPSLVTIVDQLAHEILRRYLAQDKTNRIELLDSAEFISLADVLVNAAQINRMAIRGRPTSDEFAKLVKPAAALADKVPNWPELGYLAARIADSGRDSANALLYYRRVLPQFEDANKIELIALVNGRISALTQELEPSTATGSAAPLPAAVDYASKIKFIRDSGPEGSVVGLALATALEYQVEKATGETHRISARYIYYAAREAGGYGVKADTGAQISDAIKVLSTKGAVEESVWPYQPGKFADPPPSAVDKADRFRIGAARQLHNMNDIKRALNENGPVVAGIPVFQEMMSAEASKTGIIPLPAATATVIGGHAIVIVGYDDATQRVKFVNSWGTNWGDHGFGYLPYEYIDKYMNDAWTFKFATS
jgi:hypothetical protein